jgi:release factor glutamine methyltransferase
MIKHILKRAEQKLQAHDVPETYAKFVMNELLNDQGRNLYVEMDQALDQKTHLRFEQMMDQLCLNEPLAYVLGYQPFYGYRIQVNQDVLIPRFETEELVMRVLQAIDEYFEQDQLVLCDVATGSGAIACALKLETSNTIVHASDISPAALTLAQKNAEVLNAEVNFHLGDMLEPFIKAQIRADVVVCNPPYIPESEVPDRSVVDFEPHLALFGGEDGLKFYRAFFKDIHHMIQAKALLAFEMGYQQKDALLDLAKRTFPHAKSEVFQDMQGKDRILIVYV